MGVGAFERAVVSAIRSELHDGRVEGRRVCHFVAARYPVYPEKFANGIFAGDNREPRTPNGHAGYAGKLIDLGRQRRDKASPGPRVRWNLVGARGPYERHS